MKILVTYQSKTGFTKKYAEWISEELKCDLKELKKVKNISEYDLVIHGGWIMGGLLKGYKKIVKMNPKKLIVFGVGFTSKKDVDIKVIEEEKRRQEIRLRFERLRNKT